MANRYMDVGITTINKKRVYQTSRYPEIPLEEGDNYVYTTEGDRYDTLASQYYGDSTLWWIIAAANPQLGLGSILPPVGSQVRIPTNTQQAIRLRKQVNL